MAKRKKKQPRVFKPDMKNTLPEGMRSRGPGAYSGDELRTPPLAEGEWCDPQPFPLGGETPAPGTTSVLQAPTILMRTMLERARETKLPRVVDPEIIKRLRPDGTHFVSQARVVMERGEQTAEGKVYHWLRCHVRFALDDDPDGKHPWEAWLDFDLPFMEKLSESAKAAHAGGTGDVIPPGYRGRPNVMPMPKWVGSHSFEPVYERAAELAQMDPIRTGQKDMNTRQGMSIAEATLLSDAHVLRVDPEQVEVLPQWENPMEAFDYVEEMQLPFDPLYLDFTGPSGLGALIDDNPHGVFASGEPCRMVGALVWRQQQNNEGVLVVAPYCWPVSAPERMTNTSPFDSSGWFCFGVPPVDTRSGDRIAAGTLALHVGISGLTADAATVWADACVFGSDENYKEVGFNGYAILPYSLPNVRESAKQDVPDGDTEEIGTLVATTLQGWGELIWVGAAKALAALSITEAVEVEIVDAPVETRVRKRAEKRRWPIAKQVVIRSKSKRYATTNSTGEKANYSHRFWRRATVAHYPLGTMMADARPDLVTPCARPPESNCGFCRKVKRPATIVGPEHLPLVLKTLVRHKP